MSRKLRFFKDQIDKAGLRCLQRHELELNIELGDLEVISADKSLLSICMPLLLGYEALFFFVSSIVFFGRDNLQTTSMRYWK